MLSTSQMHLWWDLVGEDSEIPIFAFPPDVVEDLRLLEYNLRWTADLCDTYHWMEWHRPEEDRP